MNDSVTLGPDLAKVPLFRKANREWKGNRDSYYLHNYPPCDECGEDATWYTLNGKFCDECFER